MKMITVRLIGSLLLMGIMGCQLSSLAPKQAAADQNLWKTIEKRGSIRFGVKADAPPFGAKNEDGFWGFDIDIASSICENLGLKAEFVPVTSGERIHKILSREVDVVIASMTITRERENDVDFTIPYFQDGQGFLVSIGSGIQTNIDLKDKKVAAVEGSTSSKNMAKLQADSKVIPFSGYDPAMDALLAGEVDALTSDYMILKGLLIGHPGAGKKLELVSRRFTIEPYGMALLENQSDLRDILNNALMNLWSSGRWQESYETWFGQGSVYDMPHTSFRLPVTP